MGGSNELVECFCGAVAEGGSGAVVEFVGDGVVRWGWWLVMGFLWAGSGG